MTPQTRIPRAFTLVELLIVVAILAVLVSILLPSLSSARRQARSAVCKSNLRQLSVSAQMYIEAFEVYPPFRLKQHRGATYINAFGRQKPRWQWFLQEDVQPAIDPRGFTLPFGDGSVATDGRTGLELTGAYFLDPAMTGEHSTDIRNGPYGYNYQFLGNSRTDDAGQFVNWPVRADGIRSPAGTVLFADSRGGASPHGKHAYTLDPPIQGTSPAGDAMPFGPGSDDGPLQHSPIEMRHDGVGNVAFLDTHVESLDLVQLGYVVGDDGVAVGLPEAAGAASNRLWTGR